jgi:hypothetical protein
MIRAMLPWKMSATNTVAAVGKTCNLSTAASAAIPSNLTAKNEITAAMIRTLYRDFIHIVKVQQKESQSKSLPKEPLQQVRDAFRQPLVELNDSSASAFSAAAGTIESRYQHGINRCSFLRMNTRQYKPRTYNHTTITAANNNTAVNGTERYIYKNGQRFALHSLQQDGTLRHNQRGYVVSPYDGKNLDPQSVTRHRQNLKRAGFINNAHAKGMF